MSFLVATMKKNKAENLNGIFMHDFRRTENHSNKEIDVARSADNFELIDHQRMSKQVIMDYISAKRTSKRAVRKDAVVLNEWIVSSDQEFFKGLDADKTRQYFQTAVDWFGQEFGKDNLQYGVIHMDETTPHMHLGIVPINGDGTLSGKKMFDRNALKRVQSELPKYLAEHGFDIQRGIAGQKKKHLTTKEYKAVQVEKEAIKHELAVASADLAQSACILKVDHDEAVNQLDKLDLKGIMQSLRRLLAKLRRRFHDLVKREKAVAERESALTDREHAVAEQEKAVNQKVAAFDEFLNAYQAPNPSAQQAFYFKQLNDGVIKPAEKLYTAIKGVDDESAEKKLKVAQNVNMSRQRSR